MKSILFIIGFVLSLLWDPLKVEAADDPHLEKVVAQVFHLLTQDYAVSRIDSWNPVLLVNATKDQVPYPDSKGPEAGTVLRKEWVPRDSGIVLYFHPPFERNGAQKDWSTWHNPEKRRFEMVVPLPDQRIIAIHGSYGSSFRAKYIDRMIELLKVEPSRRRKT